MVQYKCTGTRRMYKFPVNLGTVPVPGKLESILIIVHLPGRTLQVKYKKLKGLASLYHNSHEFLLGVDGKFCKSSIINLIVL